MPHIVRTFRITADGTENLDFSGNTLDAVSTQLPNGAYTTFRTYDHDHVYRLNAHFDRLEESTAFLGRPIHLDRDHIRRALQQVLEEANCPESRIRLTVPLNANQSAPTTYISVEPFVGLNPALYRTGARAMTVEMTRDRPRAKATSFITPARRLRRDFGSEIHEVLMVSPAGEILEGLSSNFFAIRDGVLYTAAKGILEGMTRAVMLEVAPAVIPTALRPVRRDQIPDLAECFITSASREVLPIVSIDNQPVGSGQPGPLTTELHRRFCQRIHEEAEEVTSQRGNEARALVDSPTR